MTAAEEPDPIAEVRITCGSRDEATHIADALIERRLAACVHLIPIASVYEWEGTVEHDQEILVAAITRAEAFEHISSFVDAAHSYDLPAVTVTPLVGSAGYHAWVLEQTAR